MAELLDTNVIVRFLIESPESIPERFSGVFPFFEKVERGEVNVHLPALVLFQTFFVLTSYYEVPISEAAEKLESLLSFRGLTVPEKSVTRDCLRLLQRQNLALVDAYIVAHSKARGLKTVYSFDTDLEDCCPPVGEHRAWAPLHTREHGRIDPSRHTPPSSPR